MRGLLEVLAIIPARGGSKGIPRKNIKKLLGKPLVGLTIENCKNSAFICRTVVSTDDEEIARISKEFGAEVINRPSQISGDNAPSELALLHVLDNLAVNESYCPDLTVLLQCTSPLILPEDIDWTIQSLLDNNADVAFAVTKSHQFLWTIDNMGNVTALNHDQSFRPMRQSINFQFSETGAIYVMKTNGLIKHKHRFFGKLSVHVIPENRSIDIDEPIDLNIAETFILERQQRKVYQLLPDVIDAIILDFDGVFTDNRVLVFEDGREAVICNRSDGLGISMTLKSFNIPIVVVSSETNQVVKSRCDKLNIKCITDVKNKLSIIKKWIIDNKFNHKNVIYVGNDINDMECIQYVGCGIAVNDACDEVKKCAKIILQSSGGKGAIRELLNFIFLKMERG